MIFVETLTFTRLVQEYLSDDAYRELQSYLIQHPEAGVIIAGSGGLRKVRWTVSGKGKSGGVRVIYFLVTREKILMVFIYPKGKQDDLSADQLKRLRRIIEEER
jgi:hypothetical protein